MSDLLISRRHFLSVAGCAAASALCASGGIMPKPIPFECLVVGDSLIWGQGLEEKDKFYTLTKEWLEREAFDREMSVNLRVRAHSGSTLKFHPIEAAAFRKAGRDETHHYEPEVNVGFPSIWKQIEVAADEYKAAGSAGPDLIMLTGGITDITVARVLEPFGDDDRLRAEIRKYCQDDMYDVLELASEKFPNASIAVIGYYPIIGPGTPASKLYNSWFEAMDVPGPVKPLANNVLTRQMMKGIRKKGISRSRIWFEESSRHFELAVERLNTKLRRRQAVFVRSPITEDHSLATNDTKLFRMGKKGRVDDPLYDVRVAQCRIALPELKHSTGIRYSTRLCEIAAIGHPDPAGARAYAEAIKTALKPVLTARNLSSLQPFAK